MKYQEELEFLKETVITAHNKYAKEPPKAVKNKTVFDLVTEIDVSIEQYISLKISEKYPQDKIHGEETTHEQIKSGRTWTIDPIDGTCNFVSGIPLNGVQCSLTDKGEVVVSVIYTPVTDSVYYAVKGEGAFCNGERLKVKTDFASENAIVCFGDYSHKKTSHYADLQHNAIKNVYGRVAKIRMFGASSIDFTFDATNKVNGLVLTTKNLWDILPGFLICTEAGAIVSDLDGNPYKWDADGIIVANNLKLHKIIVDAFKN